MEHVDTVAIFFTRHTQNETLRRLAAVFQVAGRVNVGRLKNHYQFTASGLISNWEVAHPQNSSEGYRPYFQAISMLELGMNKWFSLIDTHL